MSAIPIGLGSIGEPEALLALALSRPPQALTAALATLAANPPARVASIAHQAAGIVLRDFGDINEAVTHLRSALRFARLAGDAEQEADVRGSLGVALVKAGQPRRGLAMVDAVVSGSSGVAAARFLIRRAHGLWLLGRYSEMLDDARRAVVLLRDTNELVWLARAYDHRAAAHIAMGAVDLADADYARCETLYTHTGQLLELAVVRQERGAAAFARGDLPTALGYYADALRRFDELSVFEPELHVNKCAALLAAGLPREALAEADGAVTRIEQLHGSATRRAELLHSAALAAYECGALDVAERRSRDALRLFRRQERLLWAARTELVLVQCGMAAEDRSPALLRRARRVARELDELSPVRAVDARLLVGRLALARGYTAEAREHLRSAARARPALGRPSAASWLARATLNAADGRRRAMLSTCARGLRALDVHLEAVGSTELRVLATAQRAELVKMALRHGVQGRDPRLLLTWSERGRATVLAVPPVRPGRDSKLVAELAALRSLANRLETGDHADSAHAALQRERRRREAVVREHVLQTPGTALDEARRFDPAELLEHLGDADLVELIDVDGQLHAVVAGHGRCRLRHIGPTAAADHALARALFALRREGTRSEGRPVLDLDVVGARLEADLLGGATDLLSGGPVVVVPTSRLHSVPWNLLPTLRDRPTSVVPSATTWLRALRAAPPPDARVVLVGGPRLSTGVQEVRRLARQYPEAVLLAEGTATVERVMATLDGAWLAHIAAHGTFRADSPLFSALQLDDGPLTVYDLERLDRAPHRVVLSSCNTAVGAPSGADELIGLVSALLSLGSIGVVASVVPVDDPATIPLMLALHEWLRTGVGLAEAVHLARRAVSGEPRARAAADSFIALGV
jgi:tetratricopeptide (TPR) repeat protein